MSLDEEDVSVGAVDELNSAVADAEEDAVISYDTSSVLPVPKSAVAAGLYLSSLTATFGMASALPPIAERGIDSMTDDDVEDDELTTSLGAASATATSTAKAMLP